MDSKLEVKSVIVKQGAFNNETTLHIGVPNYCYKGNDDVFHLFLDCDDVKLRKIFEGIILLRKRFPELAEEKFLILGTSPFHFSVASFVRLTWNRCRETMTYAVEIGLEHYGHAFYSYGKGYAVLRFGAKNGIVPQLLYSVGDTVVCKRCFKEFKSIFSLFDHAGEYAQCRTSPRKR
jgi:hypothetical protein